MAGRLHSVGAVRLIGTARIVLPCLVIGVLGYTYAAQVAAGLTRAVDFFGFFTNQTNILAGLTMIAGGVYTLRRRQIPPVLDLLRAIGTTCLIVVAVVFNLGAAGEGVDRDWVSAVMHGVFPALVTLDWLLLGDRRPLSWPSLGYLLPYPLSWLGVVLMRGSLDGWVPYSFLHPDNGVTLLLHVAGLVVALLAAGALVWGASRSRGMMLRLHHEAGRRPVAALPVGTGDRRRHEPAAPGFATASARYRDQNARPEPAGFDAETGPIDLADRRRALKVELLASTAGRTLPLLTIGQALPSARIQHCRLDSAMHPSPPEPRITITAPELARALADHALPSQNSSRLVSGQAPT